MLGPAQSHVLGAPVAISLDRLVPRDHFYRYLEATLDLGFVRDWVRGAYSDRGRPSVDPVVFFKLYEEQGIRAYMPLPEWDKSSPYYHAAAFAYDGERDVYRCPQGQVLKLEWTDEAGERAIYRARAATCNACPVKSGCTRSNQGRLVSRSFHAGYLAASAATGGRRPTRKRSGNEACGSSRCSPRPSSGTGRAGSGCGAWLTRTSRHCSPRPDRT